jgi:hypothetical protein
VSVDPETEVLLLVGSQEGTAHLPLAGLDPGDAALLLDPYYPSHMGGLHLASAAPVLLHLDPEAGWRPDFERLTATQWQTLKLMVLGFPHNPTATTGEQAREVFDTARNMAMRQADFLRRFGVSIGKHDITIPDEHLDKEVKQRGRPKSLSPRATKGKGKVATTDTTPASSRNASDADNSDTETETDEPVTAAAAKAKAPKATGEKKQKQQEARKKVVKTAEAAAAAAADSEAPKKRGRPAKAKEPAVEVNESLIHDLVSSASGRASDAASSVEQELTEDNITPVAASPATPAKKAATPTTPAAPKKATALKKKAARTTEVVNGMTMWVEAYEGSKIWVNPQDMAVYDASNGEGVGTWDDVNKTIRFEDDEEIEQFSEEE